MKSVLFFILMTSVLFAQSQEKLNPVIKNYGTIYNVPFAVEKPDPSMKYKVLVDIKTENDKPELVSEYLDNVARMVNLHALGGVPAKNLDVIVIIHGPAVLTTMNNETYHQKFGVDNPNLPLITALSNAGVRLFVCGQTLFKKNINYQTIAPEIKVALSALTTITTYSLKGYAGLKF